MDERNIIDRVNNVTVANDWRISPNGLKEVCVTHAIGYAILSGTYGLDNFSSGTPLTLIEPGVRLGCQAPGPREYYSFEPLSDNATMSSGMPFPFTQSPSSPISVTDSVAGYWTGNATSSKFNDFPAGSYTVLAVDEWGQVALLHFSVKNG